MTLLTRCPNCTTTFRVQDVVLAGHGGRVRCGHCHFVFDARACRVETSAGQIVSHHTPPPADSPSTPPALKITPIPEPPAPQKEEPHHLVTALQAGFEELEHPLPKFTPADEEEETERILEMRGSGPTKPVVSVYRPQPMADVVVSSADWLAPPKPRGRRLRWLVSTILLLTLVAQAAVMMRQTLVEWQPALRPLLISLCSPMRCQVSLSHNVEMLALDGVEFSADTQDIHRLQLSGTLRNLAGYPQAWPMLDVQLLDSQGRLVARRPLPPRSYLAAIDATQPEFAAEGEAPFSLVLHVDGLDVANYRLGVEY